MAFPVNSVDAGVPAVPIISVETSPVMETSTSGVAWPAVFGGALGALAITLLLFTLGSGVGLSSISPWRGSGASLASVSVASAIWLVVMHWAASGFGGYLAGRLRNDWSGVHSHEVFFRDTANGFLAWAAASLAGVVILANAAAFVVSGTAAVASNMGAGLASGAVQAAARPGDPTSDTNPYLLDRLFRADSASTNGRDGDARHQAAQIILNGFKAGDVPAPDRAYLAKLVADQTAATPDEAARRVDQFIGDAKAAEVKVQQTADTVRKAAARLSILTALAMLIGAFVACVAAALGGQRRDAYQNLQRSPPSAQRRI